MSLLTDHQTQSLGQYADGKICAGIIDRVGHLVINNPERHNAIGLAMWEGAAEALAELSGNSEARLLIVSGAGGKAFASGADISKFESERSTPEDVNTYQNASGKFYSTLNNFPKPTIAAVTGYCIGGGMALAVSCDLRICEERARFAIPAAKLGLGYGYDGIKRLSDLVGIANTREIFFTARQFSSTEAYEMGLVNRVVPQPLFHSYIDDYATRIRDNAPMTIATVKEVTNAVVSNADEQEKNRLAKLVRECFESEDYIEGRRAFMEKRKPEFKGL